MSLISNRKAILCALSYFNKTDTLGFALAQARYTIAVTVKHSRTALIVFIVMLTCYTGLCGAASSPSAPIDDSNESVASPLVPDYVIAQDGSVTLRICFNWSCANRQNLTFTADDMTLLKQRMAICSGSGIYERLQQVRIGIWQMEQLAQKYQPLLANDLSINDFEADVEGRMDCIDNSSNTTTYLHILHDIGELAGWTVSTPSVRNIVQVHWTAVIIDIKDGSSWSVDSWYRPNSHLPMVMPLQNWIEGEKAWESPFGYLNSTPRSVHELCNMQRTDLF